MKATVFAVMLVALAFAGCVQAPDEDDDGPGGDVEVSHVHGLAYDPGVGAVFVATHNGLAKGTQDDDGWSWSYVGRDRHDYMGFTQDAGRPGVFYSSGHPEDAKSFGGPHLGLRRSVDGGETWAQRSLKGQVDFHALTSIPGAEGWLAGFWQGQVKVSKDGGATWTDHPAPDAQVLALAGAAGRLFAGTTQGLYVANDLDALGDWASMNTTGLPTVVLTLAVSPDGERLFASGATGRTVSTHRSLDGGTSWTQLDAAKIPTEGAPVLFAVDPANDAHVFASTSDALVVESRDEGETWTMLRSA